MTNSKFTLIYSYKRLSYKLCCLWLAVNIAEQHWAATELSVSATAPGHMGRGEQREALHAGVGSHLSYSGGMQTWTWVFLVHVSGKLALHLLPESQGRSQKEHFEWAIVSKCHAIGPGGSKRKRWRKIWSKWWQSAEQGPPFLVQGHYNLLTQTVFIMLLKSLFFPSPCFSW